MGGMSVEAKAFYALQDHDRQAGAVTALISTLVRLSDDELQEVIAAAEQAAVGEVSPPLREIRELEVIAVRYAVSVIPTRTGVSSLVPAGGAV